MLYRGTKPGALYKGAYKPGKLYKGAQLVAGYADVSKAAPASWDGTYDDVMGVTATGKGKQQTYSGRNLFDFANITSNPVLYTIDYDAQTITIAARINNAGYLDTMRSLCPGITAGQYILTAQTSNPSAEQFIYIADTAKVVSFGTPTNWTDADLDATFAWYNKPTADVPNVISEIMVVAGSTATAYEPYVGGQPSPSPDYPQPLVAAEGALTASGRTGTTPTTVTPPVLRAIPGSDIRDEIAYIGSGQWQVTRRVGVVQLTGTETWTVSGQYREDKMDWYYISAKLADAVDRSDAACACTHYRHGVIANNTTMQGVGIVWRAIRVRYGDPPDGTDAWKAFLAAQAAAGDPVTIWYALATPTAETLPLGELPSYPVHTELAVNGDYPPDVTGTVKVGN